MRYLILITVSIITLLTSCDKDLNGNGNILAHVQHNGKAIDQPMIYVKLDSQASETSFDYRQSGDAIGEAYFKNLKPGTYYIFSKGYDPSAKQYLTGTKTVTIQYRSRQNESKVFIDLN